MEQSLIRLFLDVLNMSVTASYVILAVLLLRVLLRKAPKIYSYALWSVVGFRLACPVSVSSALSLFNLEVGTGEAARVVLSEVPKNTYSAIQPQAAVGLPAVNEAINAVIPPPTPMASMNPVQLWIFLGMVVWVTVMAGMVLHSVVSYIRLKKKLETAVRLEENVFRTEQVRSPFILGFVRPRIYVPYGLEGEGLDYVLLHERTHLRRGDHWIKSAAWLLLILHWFNPLVWLAFHLMVRDMEMSCDEAVLAKGENIRKAYSTTLLSLAMGRRFPSPSPLAFGESDVKNRIRNALKWKQPKKWLCVLAAGLCVAAVCACGTDPKENVELPTPDVPKEEVSVQWGGSLGFELFPGQGIFSDETVVIPEDGGEVKYQITYARPGLTLEAGLEGEDGTEHVQTVTGGQGQITLKNIPAGNYRLFVRNPLDNQDLNENHASGAVVYGTPEQVETWIEPGEEGYFQREEFGVLPGKDASIGIIGGADTATAILTGNKLEQALYNAILTHNLGSGGGEYGCASFEIIDVWELCVCGAVGSEPAGQTFAEVYAWAMYQEFDPKGNGIEAVHSRHLPVKVTFEVVGEDYVLTEYWEPTDGGSNFVAQVREKFPPELEEQGLDSQKSVVALTQQCYYQAASYFGLDVDAVLEEMLEQVVQRHPDAQSSVWYATMDIPEYREMVYYGEHTLRFVCREFLKGGQTDLRGSILRSLLEDLTGIQIGLAGNGQEYFDAMVLSTLTRYREGQELDETSQRMVEWGRSMAEFYMEHVAQVKGATLESMDYWKGENPIVEFRFSRLLPKAQYFGVYYSASDQPAAFQGVDVPLMRDGDSWTWTGEGDNKGWTQRLGPGWYYFEASF